MTIESNEHHINFARDLRIFGSRLGDNLNDAAAQVAAVDLLPTMGIHPGLAETRAHLLEVAAHLNGEVSYIGGHLELHTMSVVGRAMRIANAFASEDLRTERDGSGGLPILTSEEWCQVHRAIVNGCAGTVPVLRRNGTLRPPRWVLDLLQSTTRLAEIGWGHDELAIKRRALAEPSRDERKAAAEMGASMIRRKSDFLKANPDAVAEGQAWVRFNQKYLAPTPRPEGHLAIDEIVHVRMSAKYRTPAASLAIEQERRARERSEAGQTRLIPGAHSAKPIRADKEVVDILRDNQRKGAEHARNSRRNRGRAVA